MEGTRVRSTGSKKTNISHNFSLAIPETSTESCLWILTYSFIVISYNPAWTVFQHCNITVLMLNLCNKIKVLLGQKSKLTPTKKQNSTNTQLNTTHNVLSPFQKLQFHSVPNNILLNVRFQKRNGVFQQEKTAPTSLLAKPSIICFLLIWIPSKSPKQLYTCVLMTYAKTACVSVYPEFYMLQIFFIVCGRQ